MAVKLYTEAYIQNIANAIREKNGLTTRYKVGQMANAILNIPTGGDLLALMTGSEQFDLTDSTVPTTTLLIPSYMFYRNANVKNVGFDSVLTIGANAFQGCGYIENINFPNVTEIQEKAFLECRRSSYTTTSTISLPKVVTIGQEAFREFNIDNDTFDFNLPECTTIGLGAFRVVNQNYSFAVRKVNLPKVQTIGNYGFQRCEATDFIIGPNCSSIGVQCFESAIITNLHVQATTPPTVGNSNLGTGTITHIYVPSASVSAYKGASGWSTYASIIEAEP